MHWTVQPGRYCMRFPPSGQRGLLPRPPESSKTPGIVARRKCGVKGKPHKIWGHGCERLWIFIHRLCRSRMAVMHWFHRDAKNRSKGKISGKMNERVTTKNSIPDGDTYEQHRSDRGYERGLERYTGLCRVSHTSAENSGGGAASHSAAGQRDFDPYRQRRRSYFVWQGDRGRDRRRHPPDQSPEVGAKAFHSDAIDKGKRQHSFDRGLAAGARYLVAVPPGRGQSRRGVSESGTELRRENRRADAALGYPRFHRQAQRERALHQRTRSGATADPGGTEG